MHLSEQKACVKASFMYYLGLGNGKCYEVWASYREASSFLYILLGKNLRSKRMFSQLQPLTYCPDNGVIDYRTTRCKKFKVRFDFSPRRMDGSFLIAHIRYEFSYVNGNVKILQALINERKCVSTVSTILSGRTPKTV